MWVTENISASMKDKHITYITEAELMHTSRGVIPPGFFISTTILSILRYFSFIQRAFSREIFGFRDLFSFLILPIHVGSLCEMKEKKNVTPPFVNSWT